ncbi:histidine kinase dimerization/phospho-acceptor domain-containing protein [Desulfosarcina cetonica]|uniref:histidine kinase dimerization/phospho-acceptor domain-containing protein n=1 Tax=Desulfosarcina cetonica TaxID=90730 RepID=UPI00155DC404|nr:histidine kinase dimerization/phospho-acceptor domain-containing protein [Desulfosarcina cetonica]
MLSEDKYRIVTEFVNDGILVLQDGITVFENPACRSLVGQSVKGWTIEDFSTLLGNSEKEKLLRFYDSLVHSRDQGNSIVLNVGKEDDFESVIEIRANTIAYKSGTAFLAVLRDITEQIRKEKELKESEEKVARLKKMESLGLLAGGVAHDLNNVLSGIVSYPELILMDLPEDSKLKKPLLTIQDSGTRATAIVNELLTIARGAAIEKR